MDWSKAQSAIILDDTRSSVLEVDLDLLLNFFDIPSELDKMGLERILRAFRLDSRERWRVINGQARPIEQKQIELAFTKLRGATSVAQKLQVVLTAEYGEVLERLTDREVSVEELSMDKIVRSNLRYTLRSPESLRLIKRYKKLDPSLPRGVVEKKSDEEYQLLDGFHRFEAGKQLGLKKCRMWVVGEHLGH